MPTFKITLLGLLYFSVTLASGSKCPQDAISKLVVCYYKGETSLIHHNICNCTHLVFTNGVKRAENNSFTVDEETAQLLETVKDTKENLSTLFTFETKQVDTSAILKSENRSEEVINGIVEFLLESQFDGIELNLKFAADDGVQKESYASFVKKLSKTLSSQHRRIKREGYDVFEKLTDDITTASYTTQTPKNSTSKAQSIKQGKPKESNRKVRENTDGNEEDNDDDEKNVDYVTLEEAINAEFAQEKSQDQLTLKDVEEEIFEEKNYLVFVRLPIKPEIVAKKYDLKVLSRYSDILMVPTHNIVNSNEEHLTYHPSRLMGLSDILNTDSILDFLTGMGAPKSKMVISLPATVLKFQLKDENINTPRSPAKSKPQVIDQSQLCSLFNKNNWTIERDDDLTAPYAFSGKTWLAFEDEISVNIKGKYILLRELAGGAIYPIDADVNDGLCTNHTGTGGYLSGILHKNFESLERKPRALVLESLQEQIHDTAFTNVEAGVRLSEYRIVRVVDHSGAVHVIRKNTKTQFECSRQGYFSHPLGCNKFYRCVKFDQYSDEYTVFEYDCPAGLAFDERWEVCVWPGSLPHGAPCTGSSEIAPVPRSHYQCPNREGYYADPENCRWFFACLDHSRDGITPLTAYEFRCPFGLVFSEEKLACDWPWLVGGCGSRGAAGYLQVTAGGQSQGFHSATFINGGNLEASLGQYGNREQESAFAGFGKKFGSVLKGTNTNNAQGAYQGAQSAGFGYIASQYDDRDDRASFAAFPDYQISGGRILNTGGLVLNQNVAGISNVAAGGAVGGLEGLNIQSGASKSSRTGAGYLHQDIDQFGNGIQSTSNVKFQKARPTVQTGGLEIIGISNAAAEGAAGDLEALNIQSGGSKSLGAGAGYLHQSIGQFGSGIQSTSNVEFQKVRPTVQTGGLEIIGISSAAAGGAAGGSEALNIQSGGSKSLGAGTGYVHQGIGQFGNGIQGTSNVEFQKVGTTVQTGGLEVSGISNAGAGGAAGAGYLHQGIGEFGSGIQSTSNTEFQKVGSSVQTGGLEIAGISSGGQASFQHPVSTPRPFAVNIPSVQINAEKVSEYSGHSTTIGHTTPQTLVFQGTPHTESVNILTGKAVSTAQGFTVSQPTLSVGIPAVTPSTETHISGGAISGASHLSTPSVSFVSSSPRTESHRFGQNQFSNEISINQAAVTAGIPAVTGTFKYGSTVSGGKSEALPITVPLVTPKPGIGAFEYTASGFGVGISESSSPTETPFGGFTQFNHGLTEQSFGRKSLEKSVVSVESPAKIPGVQTHVIKNINAGQSFGSGHVAFGQTGVSYEAPVPTATPSVFANGGKIGSESHLSTVYSGPTLIPLTQTSIDQKISNELRFNTPQTSYAVPSVTPKTDFGAFSKVASKIPTVTGKPDQQILSQAVTGKYENAVIHGIPLVTPQPELNSFKFYGERTSAVAVTPVVPFGSSDINAGIKSSFGQGISAEAPKRFSPAVYNVPDAAPQNNFHAFQQTSSFQQKGISQAEKVSYSIPAVTTNANAGASHTFVTPKPSIKFSQPVQSGFGQQYAYSSSFNQDGSQFKTVQPFGGVSSTQKPIEVFGSKLEQSNILTDVSIKQQPVVTVGTIGSTSIDHTFSTPSSSASAKIFPQTPSFGTINFKSSYIQPQPVTVTTAFPDVSVTPATPVKFELNQPSPHSLNVFGKSLTHYEGEKIGADISGPALQQTVVSGPGDVIFNQKSFKQEIKSSPSAVTTPIPLSYNEEISTGFGSKSGFYDHSVYLPPVTPKTEIFGATLQKNSHVSFGTAEENHLLQKEQPKLIVNQIQQQVPVQVSAGVPNYQHGVKIAQVTVTTSKPYTPREELVELEIKKSVEINPSVITKSAEAYLPPNPSGSPFVIQQQPLHLVSQKTFPAKQILKPSYTQQEKEIVHLNSIPENTYQEQFAFQQVDVKTQEQKQYIPPAVTPIPSVSYSSAKSVNFPQPAVFSERNAGVSSILEPTRVPFASHTEAIISGNKINAGFEKSPERTDFAQQYENRQSEVVSSKVNLLLPTVTELPKYTTSQAEEFSVQTHRNFDSQKISKFGRIPVQNVFVQTEIGTTSKPFFESSGHLFQYNRENLTSGHSAFGSGIKYGINPNIAIPEPPREYILAQNAYTTIAPEIVATGRTSGQFQSTESVSSGTTYLPPKGAPRRKPSKATIISVGNVNEEVPDDNVQQLFDKYSGRFGQVINGNSDKFVTKVINGEGKGRIEIDKQGSSTVQYEVSSTTPRQRGRGRQYHGGITSGIQATNKYEEYEIDGQRSFDAGQDKSEGSKTTIDLKNLKLEKDKKTVIVVSQVSDANPVLIGKLAGQCSCQSNMLEVKSKGSKSKSNSRRTKISQNQQQHPTIINEYLPPYEDDQASSAVQFFAKEEASTAAPETVLIGGSRSTNGVSYTSEQNFVSSSTTAHPDVVSSTILSSLGTNGVLSITPKALYDEGRPRNKKKQFRGKTRFLAPVALSEDGSSNPLLSPVSASDIAFDYGALKGDESRTQNEIDGGSSGGNPKILAGAAFDRYGPGGWRSFDETLQGSIDCKRPGLFRHPKYCNKFYACNYDPWKEQYTLHVFNCPIRLTYDSSISACNWPVGGPACADDNLLV